MKKILITIFVLIVICAIWFFIRTPSPVLNIQDASATVNIKSFAFSPSQVNIKVGDKVVWTNLDSAPHDVTFENGEQSKTLAQGESFDTVFNEPGTYPYICSIHPSMKGTVIVSN
ncbi:MAG: cupredoxin family copper-binding protein [Patescibacteria group bacterium]|nr:cupredoxin family copper-binding protein [Patescibacteria group bacterium]